MDKASLLKTISDHDTKLIENLKAETSKLAQEKKTYDQKKEELTQQLDDLNAKNDELTQLSEESGIKLSQYRQQQQEAIQGLDNNSAELEQLNSDIEAYYERCGRSMRISSKTNSPASRIPRLAAGARIRLPAVTMEAAAGIAAAETMGEAVLRLIPLPRPAPLPALITIPGLFRVSIGFPPLGTRTGIPITTAPSISLGRESTERRFMPPKAVRSALAGIITAAGAAVTVPTA